MNQRLALQESWIGALYGVGAYGWWALAPLYFKATARVPALEMLAHRVVWSLALLAILVSMWRGWGRVRQAFQTPRVRNLLFLTTLLIGVNWLIFIWSVANDHMVESSLGYYINPLVNVLFGWVILRERLSRGQWLSVALAAVGVVYLAVSLGKPPWISFALAASFSTYALCRKLAPVDGLTGVLIESMLLTPVGVAYLIYLGMIGTGAFRNSTIGFDVLLIMAGFVTATPMLFFVEAAARLRLATLGLLQYIAPSGQLLLAVALYGERFTHAHVVSFVMIWLALGLYSLEAWRVHRSSPRLRESLDA